MHTKDRIFEAALDLFSEKGFSATSVREITGRAGVTPGSLYNHFASKNDLLRAVYDHYTELFIGPQAAPDYESLLKEYGVMELFHFLTESYIGAMRNEKLSRLTKIILMEQYVNPVAADIAFRDRQRLVHSMEELFVTMARLGYIQVRSPAVSGRMLAYVYLGFSADNIYDYYMRQKAPDEIAAQQNEAIETFLKAILIIE